MAPAEFEAALLRCNSKVLAHAVRCARCPHRGEDLCQTVLSQAVDLGGGYFTNEDHVRCFLFRALRNRLIDETRRQGDRRTVSLSASTEDGRVDIADYRHSPAETDERLSAAVNRLNDEFRELLSLRYVSDLSVKDIGEIVGRPANTVSQYIKRAKDELRQMLKAE